MHRTTAESSNRQPRRGWRQRHGSDLVQSLLMRVASTKVAYVCEVHILDPSHGKDRPCGELCDWSVCHLTFCPGLSYCTGYTRSPDTRAQQNVVFGAMFAQANGALCQAHALRMCESYASSLRLLARSAQNLTWHPQRPNHRLERLPVEHAVPVDRRGDEPTRRHLQVPVRVVRPKPAVRIAQPIPLLLPAHPSKP